MINRVLLFLSFLLLASSTFAFEVKEDSIPEKKKLPKQQFYSPTIGLGIGMFKFYGDVLDVQKGNPLVSNIAYDLHVKQQLNSFLTAKFYVLFGSLSANERYPDRNLNFKSTITTGGFALMYNFDHLLPKNRKLNPFISLGIESIEFHSKTDLYDAYGNKYNYWSDGSIRNLAEDDPNANQSIIIQRDYTYETDLRELDYDGKGKYPERTFGVPIGAGVQLHLTKNIDFTLGTTLHMTFTDLIDNVSGGSEGERIGSHEGTKGNDKFLMSSFSISYNFLNHKNDKPVKDFEEEIDYLAYDFIDECPWTPAGVEVDDKGCPLDKDTDFVPNYKDDELETREGAPVSPNGVEMTDDMIFEAYQRYIDSTGMFADTENRVIAAEKKAKTNKKYKVQVGSFTEAIDVDLVDKFLSIPDVEIKVFGDSLTIIAVGDYDNLPEALKRKMQLTKEGYDAAIVVTEEESGMLVSVGDEANNMAVDGGNTLNQNSNDLLFRVQLGAFSKKLPKSSFNGLKNIMEIKADDGLYKYLYSGSYPTMEEAAAKKVDLAIDFGVKDAFIVAYKGGKRIPLTEAGVKTTQKEDDIRMSENKTYDKSAIRFKVQVGLYKNQLPTEVLTKFIQVGGIDQKPVDNELTRYTSGDFESLEEAQTFKKELIEKGLGGVFVIALHNEELIPINKAQEIIGQEGE